MEKNKLKHVSISISYEDTLGIKGLNEFYNLRELKAFLDKKPEIAEKLGYVKKS